MSETTDTDDSTALEPYDDPSPPEPAGGAMSGPNEYDPVEIFDHMRHRTNGDETIVLLTQFAKGYQAIAVDVDRAGALLETEVIGDCLDDRQTAEGMCKYWIDANPKGVLGASGDDDSGGFLERLGFDTGGGLFGGGE